MLSEEHRLVSRILFDSDMAAYQKLNMNHEMFRIGECREAIRYLEDYNNSVDTLGFVPSIAIFKQHYPNFPIYEESEPLQVLCNEVRENYLNRKLDSILCEADQFKSSKVANRIKFVNDKLAEINAQTISGSSVYLAHEYADRVMDKMRKLKESKGMLGIPWPWERLNKQTHGIQAGNWIVTYGRPKSGKTTITIGVCASIYSNYNKRIGVFNFEDTPDDLMLLFFCYLADVDFILAKEGVLNKIDEGRLISVIELVKSLNTEFGRVFFVEQCKGATISYIRNRIKEMRLDIAVINGLYVLDPSASHEGLTLVSRSLKAVAMEENCAIIGLHHANQFHGRVAYSDAFNQDCDAMIKLEPIVFEDGIRGSRVMLELVRGGGMPCEFTINSRPGLDLTERETVMPQEQKVPMFVPNGKSRRI